MADPNTAPTNSSSTTSWTAPGAGITGGYDGDSEVFRIFIVCFAGLAVYNAVELLTLVLLTFKHYRGTYFWSLLIAGAGIIPYSLGFLLKFMNITTGNVRWVGVVLLTIGWWPMVTGQAFVLWSRLHLVLSGPSGERVLRYAKWVILANIVALHVPTTVLTFGSNGDTHTQTFATGYSIMEKIQMIGFFLQECTLSSIYIIETGKILRTSLQPQTRTTMKQLIAINAVIIVMDAGLLGLECASLYILETLIKGVVYSIKLKLEFAILGKLVKFVGGNKVEEDQRKSSVGFVCTDRKSNVQDRALDINEFVDLSQVRSDFSHPSQTSDTVQSRRISSRLTSADFAYDCARFQHIEDISTLVTTPSGSGSRPPSLSKSCSPHAAV